MVYEDWSWDLPVEVHRYLDGIQELNLSIHNEGCHILQRLFLSGGWRFFQRIECAADSLSRLLHSFFNRGILADIIDNTLDARSILPAAAWERQNIFVVRMLFSIVNRR